MSTSSATRLRREEDVQKAYDIQVQAGLEVRLKYTSSIFLPPILLQGGARFTAVGLGLTIVAHYTWPAFRCENSFFSKTSIGSEVLIDLLFRRQGRPFKAFLLSMCAFIAISPYNPLHALTRSV